MSAEDAIERREVAVNVAEDAERTIATCREPVVIP